MASELIQLRAKAKKAGIPASDFKGLGIADLKNLIAGSSKSAPAKGAPAKGAARKPAPAKGAPARKPAAKAPVRKPAVVKPAAKKAPAKSTVRKPATRSTAAKGTAKRPSSAVRKPATKAAARKAAANTAGRNLIDNSAIDWTADWSGGQSGNRQTIIKAVRRFKGNTEKVFNHLADQAQSMFPKNEITNAKRTKTEAQAQLRWMISRVKLDFVKATGQHESSTNRAGYGESDNEAAVARRKATAKARKAAGIKAPARGRVPNEQLPGYRAPKAAPAVRKGAAKGKVAPKRTTPQKPAQRRTAPATRKGTTAGRKPAARKPVARGRK